MIQYLSLFSGIGAFEKALENLNINYNLVGFSENNKYATKSYCKIHNINESLNFGDIKTINPDNLPYGIDLLTHGSPCTSFSVAGKGHGGDEGSGTPSSLMWYSVNIILKIKPKVVIWENVPNVLSKKHKHNFEKYINTLSEAGYINYYKILNAKDFGVAQNRKRIFCISILKTENIEFSFENIKEYKNGKTVKDILEKSVDKKYIVNRPMKPLNSKANNIISVDGIFPTLCACTHGYALGYIYNENQVRMLTPLETFRLMGFEDKDYYNCKEIKISDTQLYKQTGNSIVVPIIEEILKEIYKVKI